MANVNQVKPIPEGYSTVVPYISVKGASDAIAYYKKAFGAEELLRMPMPDGKVGHAELKIGDSIVMLADEMDHPDAVAKSPRTLGGVTSGLCLYVADCDALFNRAVEAGGKVRRPLTNQFYGDRSGTVEDPFGQVWTISTHVEDVAPDELRRRMEAVHERLSRIGALVTSTGASETIAFAGGSPSGGATPDIFFCHFKLLPKKLRRRRLCARRIVAGTGGRPCVS